MSVSTFFVNTGIPSGERIYDELSAKVTKAARGTLPVPSDADQPIWFPITSMHGSQPCLELKNGQLPPGSTFREAWKSVINFSCDADPYGGCGDVVRLSDIGFKG